MPLSDVKSDLEAYTCPSCGELGSKMANIRGIRKCEVESCTVRKFYVEGMTDNFRMFKDYEQLECSGCGESLSYDKTGRLGCNNPDCRVKESDA